VNTLYDPCPENNTLIDEHNNYVLHHFTCDFKWNRSYFL